jgi:hypothetical protein
MDNQRIIQSTPAIFSFKSWTTDVVITAGKLCAPNADRLSGALTLYIIGLIFGGQITQGKDALIVMRVDYTLRWLSIAVIENKSSYESRAGPESIYKSGFGTRTRLGVWTG